VTGQLIPTRPDRQQAPVNPTAFHLWCRPMCFRLGEPCDIIKLRYLICAGVVFWSVQCSAVASYAVQRTVYVRRRPYKMLL